jgi:formylmethanofuran dehydrogenase subunit E
MDEEYTCDECGRRFPLTQVRISGDRTVCGSCMAVEDRIID